MIRHSLAALAVWLATAMQPSTAQSDPMPVNPPKAASLAPVELSDFIADIVPNNGMESLEWDYLADGPIVWITDGNTSTGSATIRQGAVRIRVQGKIATVLKQRKEEQAWAVTLGTNGNPNVGPKWIAIGDQCFGSIYGDCTYEPSQVLTSPKIVSDRKLCNGRFNGNPEVHEITIKDKRPVLIAFKSDGGSGGIMQFVAIHPVSAAADLCKPIP